MKEQLVVRKMTLKCLPIWTCESCKDRETGSTVRIEYDEMYTFIQDLNLFVETNIKQVSRSHIPVGWSSNGADGVRCPNCK